LSINTIGFLSIRNSYQSLAPLVSMSSHDDSPTTYWTLCPKPNFTIRLTSTNVAFQVNRSKLASGSVVFRDMFGVCDSDDEGPFHATRADGTPVPQEMEIDERPEIFSLLLRLLHVDSKNCISTSQTSAIQPKEEVKEGSRENEDPWDETATVAADLGEDFSTNTEPETQEGLPSIIPLPVLRPLFDLADKYDVIPELHALLENHLTLNAPQYPLEVYAMATLLNFEDVARSASAHLISRPLSSYTMEEISILPSVESYHRLTLLHAYRIEKLREVLMNEDIFPHDYGICSKHSETTRELWNMRKRHLEWRFTAGTDLSEEMSTIQGSLQKCETCTKACLKALAMLKVSIMNAQIHTFGLHQ
jgi:hypothetical protein